MIFVTVGNSNQGFGRLLEAVKRLAEDGPLRGERIFMQSGSTKNFRSALCETRPFLTMEEFNRFMEEAELIITHGGCGTLIHALQLGKVPVAMPRRRKYDEIVNDHQLQLVDALAESGWVVPAREPGDLPGAIALAREAMRRPVKRPESNMIPLVARAIEELI